MDKRIRITFFPSDTSRIRVITLSRGLAFFVAATAIPQCLLGFWLLFNGTLRETPKENQTRRTLASENKILSRQLGSLQEEAEILHQSLDHLEAARIKTMLSAGEAIDHQNTSSKSTLTLLPFFGALSALRERDPNQALLRVRDLARFLDSCKIVLKQKKDTADWLPTGWPVAPSVSVIRTFGQVLDPFTGRKSHHPGLDFGGHEGAEVFSAGGGQIKTAGWDPLWGWCVRVQHLEGAETFYAHLQSITVKQGSWVQRGQPLGQVGQSGVSTGPHLHFELILHGERVDPSNYLLNPQRKPSV